jgi:hypothetical protein
MSDSLDFHQIQAAEIGPIPTEWRVIRLGEISFELNKRNSNLLYGREDVLSVNNRDGLVPSDRKLGN